MTEEPKKQLLNNFPAISTEAWEEKIKADLKGADYEHKLVWKTDEGIPVKPYYRSEDLDNLQYLDQVASLKSPGSAPNGWVICQDIVPGKDPEANNERVNKALKGGAQALRIQLGSVTSSGKEMLTKLFEGVALSGMEIHFQGFLGADELMDNLMEIALSGGTYSQHLKGSLGADPLGKMVSTGVPVAITSTLGNLVLKAKENCPDFKVIDVNGSQLQDSGASLVEELAFTLSMANEYIAILTSQGIGAIDAIQSIQMNLATGSNYFMEIAKLRAARILWGSICEGYGVTPELGKIRIHATSSQWNMTNYDPHVNMLRGTTEAMSSILGGADLITVLPYDQPYQGGTLFSDRIARNVQIILRDEAYLERVSDPAAGSYYIENLTDSIAEKAWDLFRETEDKGGFRKAFETGWVQAQVLESRKKKTDRVTSGKGRILGTNSFPNFNEMILEQVDLSTPEEVSDPSIIPLRPFRIASHFEEVRLETEKSGKRPKALLFKFGKPAWMTARATFSGNFFACAGYEILDPSAFETVESGIETLLEVRPDIVVLCSSDDTYSEIAPAVLKALDGNSIVVIAGHPTESLEELRKAGVNHFIHMKSNHLETLKAFNKILLK
jgi:methylmalonyl-CoA mutase